MPGATRRKFLQGAGVALAAGALPARGLASPAAFDPRSWSSVREQFPLHPHEVNLTTFLLAPHARPVQEAIDRHRRLLDRDAKRYLDVQEASDGAESRVRTAAARYLGVAADELALTDSTTMGLGLLYGGLRLPPGTEVVTTTHDFYSTHESLRLRALQTGADVRKISLYRDARTASVDEIVSNVRAGMRPNTRALALTWVHSSTGVKLPIRAIADELRTLNQRALLCVDGVHGLGVEAESPRALGCDFFVSGCHKWLFGPRGTGLIWGRAEAWPEVTPTIPTFDFRAFRPWLDGHPPPPSGIPGLPRAIALTPGGFHSFEQRWALAEAFEFRRRVGHQRAAARTHQLADRLKDGLSGLRGIRVVTPASSGLSAGLVCVDVPGRDPVELMHALYAKARVVASVTPYSARYLRFGPSILNSPQQVDAALRALRAVL